MEFRRFKDVETCEEFCELAKYWLNEVMSHEDPRFFDTLSEHNFELLLLVRKAPAAKEFSEVWLENCTKLGRYLNAKE